MSGCGVNRDPGKVVLRHPRLQLIKSEGSPPEKYQIEYRVKSLRGACGQVHRPLPVRAIPFPCVVEDAGVVGRETPKEDCSRVCRIVRHRHVAPRRWSDVLLLCPQEFGHVVLGALCTNLLTVPLQR